MGCHNYILYALIFSAGILFTGCGAAVEQQKINKANVTRDSIYNVVDKIPEFPGGAYAVMKFVKENIHYPEAARKEGIQGQVVATFVIDETGKVRDVKILYGLHPDCDREVMRLLYSMPRWKPGEAGDRKVSVHYTIPIRFSLGW